MKILRYTLPLFLILVCVRSLAQGSTDVSLFLKKTPERQLDSISSESGNLFSKLGHHGPAVENPWLAFRLYFDKRTSIDTYAKASPGPELNTYHWYPDKKDLIAGAGADYYKVGKSVGLGGVRLWDDQGLVALHPVSKRTARVKQGRDSSYMELLSEGVKYQDKEVDILIRVTVYPDIREAKVEAFSLGGETLRFATGINYFANLELLEKEGYIATWGLHPEDVAATPKKIGGAILYNKKLFEKKENDGKQILLISKPCTEIQTWITSASSQEEDIHSSERFSCYLENIKNTQE